MTHLVYHHSLYQFGRQQKACVICITSLEPYSFESKVDVTILAMFLVLRKRTVVVYVKADAQDLV